MRRSPPATRRHAIGSTLVELLVALALGSLGLSALALLSAGVLGTFDADPAAAEQQQRARSAIGVLVDDLGRAATGFVESVDAAPGWGTPGALPDAVRIGAWAAAARPGVLTVIAGARSEAHARLAAPAAAGQSTLVLARPAYCALASPTCRFAPGDDLMVTDAFGRFELAVVRAVSPPLVVDLAAPLAASWRAGGVASVVIPHSYALRADPATGLFQLVRALGAGPANPVIDFVTRFDVQWALDGAAPSPLLAPDGTVEGVTAGGVPPPPGEVGDPWWPAGETCLFARDATGALVSRLAPLGAGAVPVPLPSLADGPWCPSPSAPTRWDADLVRVADIRLSLSVAVASAHLRLPMTPPLAGSSRRAARLVPDLTMAAAVRPGRRAGGR